MGGAHSTIDAFDSRVLTRPSLVRSTQPLRTPLARSNVTVTVSAPVIECKVKPSMPVGTSAQDAFGTVPVFTDRGERRRAICAIGRQDAPAEGLRPLDARIEVLGASSDHLVLDVDDLPTPPRVGDSIAFVPGYSATLQLFTSRYVAKEFIDG